MEKGENLFRLYSCGIRDVAKTSIMFAIEGTFLMQGTPAVFFKFGDALDINSSLRCAERHELIGHYRCYGMSGNADGINAYYRRTMHLAFKWVNRRSQKKSMTWGYFNKYLSWNPLPMPKIYRRLTIA